VQANESVVDWQLISLQRLPVLKNSSVKSYHLEGNAHVGNSAMGKTDVQGGSMCTKLDMS
jgi:hypothetical protein